MNMMIDDSHVFNCQQKPPITFAQEANSRGEAKSNQLNPIAFLSAVKLDQKVVGDQMKLWERVSGVCKDRNSLWLAALGRRHQFRNPALEAAVIKATSHDERFVDYKNTKRVFSWMRTSPSSLLPFLVALSRRLTRTRSSTVAIKGLLLFHGVLCTNIPQTRKIGRLPFDLSAFDHSFVKSYFNFLDRKSVSLSSEVETSGKQNETVSQRLENLKRWQDLLDLLLQIRPGTCNAVIFEAMDCVVIEVFDVYSKICDAIANVMIRIYAAPDDATAAGTALEVLRRSMRQADEISELLDICREIGLLSESECPKVEKVSKEEITELERIIHGGQAVAEAESEGSSSSGGADRKESGVAGCKMTTIITHNWEMFEEEKIKVGDLIDLSDYDHDNHAYDKNYTWSGYL